jgi:octaprenyl-diphosphate synthase
VHDDVVDESPMRRGFFSIQALWKKKVAVLVGDYLLSRGLLMAVDAEAYALLRITSEAVRQMSEGELLQIEKARRLDITEEVYFDIIQRKTASLIAACCACGAASVSDDKEVTQNMKRFGELVGLAFQIKDDLLDLGDGERIGKPTGGDIRERKMTLPLIHTLNMATASERRRLIRLVKYQNHKDHAVQEVMDAIIDGPGMDYARQKMTELRDQAMALLEATPDTKAKTALIDLVDYTIERKR